MTYHHEFGARYAAFVLRPDRTTTGVDLGPAQTIDEAVRGLRDDLTNPLKPPPPPPLLDLVLTPVLGDLSNVDHVFVAPDGLLSWRDGHLRDV